MEYLFTVDCIEKTRKKKKGPGNGPLKTTLRLIASGQSYKTIYDRNLRVALTRILPEVRL